MDTTEKTSLTDWENPPTLEDLKKNFTACHSSHSVQVAKMKNWRDALLVKGAHKPPKRTGKSAYQPKLIRKQAEWRYSALSEPFLSTDDLLDVLPITPRDRVSAYHNKLILNHQFNNQLDKVTFIDQLSRRLVNEGTAIIRTGWKVEERTHKKPFPVYELQPTTDPKSIEKINDGLNVLRQNPMFLGTLPEADRLALEGSLRMGTPMKAVMVGSEEREVKETIINQPDLTICNFENVYVDPSCGYDLSKAGFIIYAFETSKSELLKSGLYSNVDKVDFDSAGVTSQADADFSGKVSGFQFEDTARRKIVAYEYWGEWDIDGTGLTKPVVITWVGDTIIRMEENPYPHKKLPFVLIPYMPVTDEVYGEPDAELLEDNQKLIGAVSRGMVDIMASIATGQRGYRSDALDPTNKRRFMRGEDYEIRGNIDPRSVVYTHEFPEIPQSALLMIQQQQQEAESITGIKAFSSGVSGDALGTTATGIRSALDAVSKRELNIIRRIAKGLVEIGHHMLAMNSVFLDDEEVIRITDDNFVTIRRESLVGRFNIKLKVSTAETNNMKANQFSFMLQTLGNTLPWEVTRIIMAELARLQEMPDIAQQLLDFTPQPDPIKQQEAQLQIMKLQMEIELAKAKTQEAYANAQLILNGKANLHNAQANLAQSQADMHNLDYLEQESGTKQAREMQLRAEQARSQGQVKVMEKVLDHVLPDPKQSQ